MLSLLKLNLKDYVVIKWCLFAFQVALFSNTLEINEEADGPIKLYLDDLPSYNVSASHKDNLYLLANLLSKMPTFPNLSGL